MVVVYFPFLFFLFFLYIYRTADVFAHCWRPRQKNKNKNNKSRFESFRWSKPAAGPGGGLPAAAKLCLCCEECTPLPEFASSRHRSSQPPGSGGCWLPTTSAPTPPTPPPPPPPLLPPGAAQRLPQRLKQRSWDLGHQAWAGGGFSPVQTDLCGSGGRPCTHSPVKSPDSLFVPGFLCDIGSLFCTVSEGHVNLGSCVFIMHSRLVRTYYPMGIYENGQYQSVQ